MPPSVAALAADDARAPKLSTTSEAYGHWVPVASTPAPFPLDIFYQVCDELVLHPERNSTSILRCDLLPTLADSLQPLSFEGHTLSKHLRRKILPRRPFDGALEQDCYFYHSTMFKDGIVVLIPRLEPRTEASVPFYHPKVAGIAFRYLSQPDEAILQVDFLPLEAPSIRSVKPGEAYYPSDSRTFRTALQLLTTMSKHGKGFNPEEKYQKRVHHDTIVPREEFQDLYLQLKEKYTWIVDEWKESTDPVKHVFEDVAIATFLICLWKDLYRETGGKPPGGFIDVGCGNGLLVFILSQEGYTGYGFDLRSRKSWSLWSGADLRTTTLSPPELCLSQESPPFPAASFLIGNHADELTPWLPLLASLTPNSGFTNIPCCCHRFTSRFTNSKYTFPEALLELPGLKGDMEKYESLSREKGGRYAAYMMYIAEQTARAGWRVEREALRIPSTKCWAFVGRKRIWEIDSEEEEGVKEWIREIATESLSTWQPRKPEGKVH